MVTVARLGARYLVGGLMLGTAAGFGYLARGRTQQIRTARPRRRLMTGKVDFTQPEWELVLESPPSAAIIVVTAQRGGTIRETLAIAQTYAETRRVSGQSELLDDVVAGRPEVDHARYRSPEDLERHVLQHLRDAISLLERKATPDEVEAYRQFVLTLVTKVADTHRNQGSAVSDAEQAAIDKISANLTTPPG
jgi:hypothetical protein